MAARERRKPHSPEAASPAQPAPSAPPPPGRPPFLWRRHAWLIAALCLWTLLPYINSFRDGLPLDSGFIVAKDTRIRAANAQNLDLIFSKGYWHGMLPSNLYRPLTTLSLLFNYAVMGDGANATGYHWVNFLLHALNVVLVYLLGLALFRRAGAAFGMAAVWAVHPALTESVTNVVGRADLLAGFGVIAGLLCHIRAGDATGRRRTTWIAALAVSSAIGIFSKESAIVLLAAMALYDFAFAGWRRRVWGYAAAIAPVLAFFYARAQALADQPFGSSAFIDNPLVAADFLTARLTAIRVIGHYLWLAVWPVRLSADYSYNQIPLFTWHFRQWSDWATLLALTVCCAVLACALWARRRNAAVFFFTLFFFAALAPTSNFFLSIGTIMAERFLYLPALCVAGCLVLAIEAVSRRLAPMAAQRFAIAAVAIVCLLLAARTFARNFDWLSDRTIWAAAAEAAPDSYKPNYGLVAQALAAKPPDLESAIHEADRAVAILDTIPPRLGSAKPYATIGAYYRKKGDAATASDKAFWYSKARAALERGRTVDRYEAQQVEALSAARGEHARAGWDPLYLELGLTCLRLDDPQSALQAFQYGRSLTAAPEFFAHVSEAYAALHDSRRQAISLMEAVVYDPSWTGFAAELVELYKRTESTSCALRGSGGEKSLDMSCPLVHDELCTAAQNIERFAIARADRDKAAATARNAVQGLGCPAAMFRYTPQQ